MDLNRTLWLEDRSGGCAADVERFSVSPTCSGLRDWRLD